MFARRFELVLALGLPACIPATGDPFSRLVSALGDTTADAGGPAISASLLVAAIAVESCVHQDQHPWIVNPGDPAPLSDTLLLALGSPVVERVERVDDGSVEATLTGADLFGFVDTTLTLEITSDAVDYALVARAIQGEERAEVGRESVTVRQGCAADQSWLLASATWTDAENVAHSVVLPASDAEGYGLHLSAASPYLPIAGTVGWKGAINGVEHSLLGDDAEALSLEDPPGDGPLPSAWWPATASGANWEAEVQIPILP